MRLVFITRKVDRSDTRTGFVIEWIEALAERLDRLYVITQEKGDASGLPANVEVHSFGKEKGYGKLRQLLTINYLLLTLGRKSNGFFCHMMPIYAIVSWLPAKLTGNKMILWYTHKSVDLKLKIATKLVDRVFTASKESFRLKSSKVKVLGHGIPLGKFSPKGRSLRQIQNSKSQINSKFQITSVGRISRVKDYESLIKAIQILVRQQRIEDIQCDIYGDPALEADFAYLQSLREFVKNAGLEDHVSFKGGVGYRMVPEIYASSDLFVNLSKTGSLDKTVLEAAAAKTLILTSNTAFRKPLESISSLLFYDRDNPKELAHDILELKVLPERDKEVIREKLQNWVASEHNLDNLADRIIEEFVIRTDL